MSLHESTWLQKGDRDSSENREVQKILASTDIVRSTRIKGVVASVVMVMIVVIVNALPFVDTIDISNILR